MVKTNNVIPVTTTTVHPDDGEMAILEYYLRCFTGPEDEVLYGLRVDMRHPGGDLIEREETPALTGSMADVVVLAKAFAAGTVMPYVLLEMVEEWFCFETKKAEVGRVETRG